MSISANSLAQAKAQLGSYTAELLIKDLPNDNGRMAAEKNEIIVTDDGGDSTSRSISCLFCGKEIE